MHSQISTSQTDFRTQTVTPMTLDAAHMARRKMELLDRRDRLLISAPRLPRWLRHLVLDDARGACWLCGERARKVGWIIAPHHGGAVDHRRNLIAQCAQCARERADLDPLDWRQGALNERQNVERLAALAVSQWEAPPSAGRTRASHREWMTAHIWHAPRSAWLVDEEEGGTVLATPLARRAGQAVAAGRMVLRASGAQLFAGEDAVALRAQRWSECAAALANLNAIIVNYQSALTH